MKNIYSTIIKLHLAIDSFVIFPTTDTNELVVYSHYVPNSAMYLRSGKYVFSTPKEKLTIEERKEKSETQRKKIFIPDIKNVVSNIKVKEFSTNSITILSETYLNNSEDIVSFAFCEEWQQEYMAVAPVTKEMRKQSSTSGEKKYFTGFKQNSDTTIYTPFQF